MERKKLWEPSDSNPNPPSIRKKRKSSKRLNACRKRKKIDNRKSSVIAKVGTKVLQAGVQNDSTNKNNKKKSLFQKKVCSKSHKKQKKKEHMPWVHNSNLLLFEIGDDGNCLFRAMSHQLYGTEECYHIIRQRCCDYIELERTYFGGFIADMTISHYLQNMRKDRTWSS